MTFDTVPPPLLTPAEQGETNEMQVFGDESGNPFRVGVEVDGRLWFIATDVTDALDIDRTAIRRIPDDEKGVRTVHTRGGTQEVATINESGLYRLMFTSRKPTAEKFTSWVTNEVLPQLRRNGAYVLTERQVTLQQMLRLAADEIDNGKREVKRIEQVVAKKNAELEEVAPKAAAYDRTVSTAAGTMSILEAGQLLQTGQNRLMAFLREIGWVRVDRDKRNVPYQSKIDAGYLVRKQGTRPVEQTNPRTGYQWTENVLTITTMVTAKGLAELARQLDKAGKQRVIGRDD